MHTITARSVNRGSSAFVKTKSSLVGFLQFLSDRKASFSLSSPKRRHGHRVMAWVARGVTLSCADFIHPTKKATAGRHSFVTWKPVTS